MAARRRGPGIVIGLLAVVALLAGPATAGAATPPAAERSYRVEGVGTGPPGPRWPGPGPRSSWRSGPRWS